MLNCFSILFQVTLALHLVPLLPIFFYLITLYVISFLLGFKICPTKLIIVVPTQPHIFPLWQGSASHVTKMMVIVSVYN
jgi:hypothetical protein